MQQIRKSAVAGSFYPKECRGVTAYFDAFDQKLRNSKAFSEYQKYHTNAIIVPHAGYVYSGFTATIAYRLLANNHNIKRVIVIGPSHHHRFEGVSGSYYEAFETPCGLVPIDTTTLIALARNHSIGFIPEAHGREHSTEVQMPFIKRYLPQCEVIELIYGDIDATELSNIITTLLSDPSNGIVISTDLSHFYTQALASSKDSLCIKAIQNLDTSITTNGCEACGMAGVVAMLIAAKKSGLTSKVLDYRTSADYRGETSSVVGYTSVLFY